MKLLQQFLRYIEVCVTSPGWLDRFHLFFSASFLLSKEIERFIFLGIFLQPFSLVIFEFSIQSWLVGNFAGGNLMGGSFLGGSFSDTAEKTENVQHSFLCLQEYLQKCWQEYIVNYYGHSYFRKIKLFLNYIQEFQGKSLRIIDSLKFIRNSQ